MEIIKNTLTINTLQLFLEQSTLWRCLIYQHSQWKEHTHLLIHSKEDGCCER